MKIELASFLSQKKANILKSVYVRYLKLNYFTYRQSIRLKRKTGLIFDESLAMHFDILIYLFS